MRKVILFMPYIIYQFLKKRNRTEYNAYTNSLMLFAIFVVLYTHFLIPKTSLLFMSYIFDMISKILGINDNSKLVKYISYLLLILLIFIFIKKRTLDNLTFKGFEYKIAYYFTAFIIWFPLFILIFIIIKILI